MSLENYLLELRHSLPSVRMKTALLRAAVAPEILRCFPPIPQICLFIRDRKNCEERIHLFPLPLLRFIFWFFSSSYFRSPAISKTTPATDTSPLQDHRCHLRRRLQVPLIVSAILLFLLCSGQFPLPSSSPPALTFFCDSPAPRPSGQVTRSVPSSCHFQVLRTEGRSHFSRPILPPAFRSIEALRRGRPANTYVSGLLF